MWSRKIKFRAFRNNTGRINSMMTIIVVLLNVFHVASLGNSGLLKQIMDVSGKFGVFPDSAQVCFKMRELNCIKTYKSGKQPPVCLSDDVSEQVTLFTQPRFKFIQAFK